MTHGASSESAAPTWTFCRFEHSSQEHEASMDDLGKRIIADQAQIAHNRSTADELERQARVLRRQADEMERLLEDARRIR